MAALPTAFADAVATSRFALPPLQMIPAVRFLTEDAQWLDEYERAKAMTERYVRSALATRAASMAIANMERLLHGASHRLFQTKDIMQQIAAYLAPTSATKLHEMYLVCMEAWREIHHAEWKGARSEIIQTLALAGYFCGCA